jgi:hypothetical protein
MSDAELNYESVQQYLEARGWKSFESARPEIGIWRTADETAEVHVPLMRTLDDYQLALHRVAEGISQVERRRLASVLGDLVRPRADALRFGLSGETTRDGSLSLGAGVDFFQSIRNALTSAACSAKRPQAYFPRMGFAEAAEYVARCRLGQTEVGSYVVSVSAPLELGVAEEVEVPNFGRRATETLITGVTELVAHVRAHTEDRFLDQPGPVSANLCQALVGMAPPDESADVILSASWSPLLPSAVPAQVIRVERELYERIELLGDQLRAPAVVEHTQTVIASVSRLNGAPDATGRMAGEVHLVPLFPSGLRRLVARLDADQYELAGRAHLNNAWVTAVGTISRVGRTNVLRPTAFSFVEGD